MFSKKNIFLFFITISLVMFIGITQSDQYEASGKLKPLDFIIDWQPEPTYLGVYYAIDTGEFEKIGYDVTVHTSWGAHQAIAAIAAGKYVIGTASGGATVLARSNNIPIKSLGVLYKDIPSVVYGLASKSMAKKPSDLEGMKIGIYPGSITNNEFDAFVRINNLDESKITKVSLTGGDIPVLLAGEIDAVLHYNEMSPAVVDVNQALPKVDGERAWRIFLRSYGVKSYGLNLITNDKAFAEQGAELKKMAQAVYSGYSSACSNKDDAVAKFVKRFPDKDKNYVARSLSLVCMQMTEPVGVQTMQGWQSTINLFDSLKLLKDNLSAKDVFVQ